MESYYGGVLYFYEISRFLSKEICEGIFNKKKYQGQLNKVFLKLYLIYKTMYIIMIQSIFGILKSKTSNFERGVVNFFFLLGLLQ